MTARIRLVEGSFRDPDSGVFLSADRVYRWFSARGAVEFEAFERSGLLESLVKSRRVIATRPVSLGELPGRLGLPVDASLICEHPRLPFISHVYEWSFEMLKAAAIHQLELLRSTLGEGYTLKDATPYNIQFVGTEPIFIDVGSFGKWEEGTPWVGYSQFCRMYLNPLLLHGLTGVPYQAIMRGSLEGIDPADLTRLLPVRQKVRKRVLIDVVLQAWLNRRFARSSAVSELAGKRAILKKDILGTLNRLQRTIVGLKSRRPSSHWSEYEDHNSYSQKAQESKEQFVELALRESNPSIVWDLGCNTGKYSILAARHSDNVVAMDSDVDTVDTLYRKVKGSNKILPSVMDLLNVSPDQGWAQAERYGLSSRGPADFVLCLALFHHLAIGGNVPIRQFMSWLADVARAGVIEFVPKTDAMVQRLLRLRKDIFEDYSQSSFETFLGRHFRIIKRVKLPESDRMLYFFAK